METEIWVTLDEFQINRCANLKELDSYISFQKKDNKGFKDYRIIGCGTHEEFQGLRNMTKAEIIALSDKTKDPEYPTYLRLKEKFES